MRSYVGIPIVKMRDYYKRLEAQVREETEEHRRKRSANNNSIDTDIDSTDGEV